MIVKVIKSYRDTEMDSQLVPRSKNKVKVLLEVEEDRGNTLIKAGVAEKYIEIVATNNDLREVEEPVPVKEEVEVAEEKTEIKEKNKNNSEKNK